MDIYILKEIGNFILSVFSYWEIFALGGLAFVLGEGYKMAMDKPIPLSVYKYGAVTFVVIAVFMAWQEQYQKVQKLEADAAPKLEITTITPQFVNSAMSMLEPNILLAVKNISSSYVKDVEVSIRDISLPNREKPYLGDVNKILPLLNEPNNKSVTISPGESKYFVFTKFIQGNGQPIHIRMGSFFVHKNEQFNFQVNYRGDNSSVKSNKLFLEYSEQLYRFGIIGKEDYVERQIPFFGKSGAKAMGSE